MWFNTGHLVEDQISTMTLCWMIGWRKIYHGFFITKVKILSHDILDWVQLDYHSFLLSVQMRLTFKDLKRSGGFPLSVDDWPAQLTKCLKDIQEKVKKICLLRSSSEYSERKLLVRNLWRCVGRDPSRQLILSWMVGKKLGSEWELAKKPGSVFSIWREDGEQKEHQKRDNNY